MYHKSTFIYIRILVFHKNQHFSKCLLTFIYNVSTILISPTFSSLIRLQVSSSIKCCLFIFHFRCDVLPQKSQGAKFKTISWLQSRPSQHKPVVVKRSNFVYYVFIHKFLISFGSFRRAKYGSNRRYGNVRLLTSEPLSIYGTLGCLWLAADASRRRRNSPGPYMESVIPVCKTPFINFLFPYSNMPITLWNTQK